MSPRLVFLAILTVLSLPAASSAKLLLITRGDTFSDLGPVQQTKVLPAPMAGFQVGYKYSYFGLFWVDLWRGSGEYCLYRDKDWAPISKAQAAEYLGVPESELHEPFFYNVPPGLIVVVVLAVGYIGTKIVRLHNKKQVTDLVNDPRYSRAFDIFREKIQENETAKAAALEKNETPPTPVDPMSAAIDHLVSTGIERPEAEEKFGKVLAYGINTANERAASGG